MTVGNFWRSMRDALGQFTNRPRSKKRSRDRHRNALFAELLERRELLSVNQVLFDAVNSRIYVGGTSDADQVTVTYDSVSVIRVQAQSIEGLVERTFQASTVNSIYFDAGNGNDRFENSTTLPALVLGGAGNDYLLGGGANDDLRGGDGDDELFGLAGNDALLGDNGRDVIRGGAGSDSIFGGNDDDWSDGGDDNDAVSGDLGNDTLLGGAGTDVLYGYEGNDSLDGGDGNDRLEGMDGDDQLLGGAGRDTLLGGLDLDTLFGGLDDDRLFGGAGNDVLNGEDGLDELNGDAGDDTLRGGSGNDLLWGYEGNDILEGGDGDDQLDGMDGDDRLIGGVGDDSLIGGMGHDVLLGGIGNDRLFGGAGNDSLDGEDGNDELSGNVGHDVLQGGAGNDTLYGHEDNDLLDGGAGDDLLEGMDGDDQLLGGAGRDTLLGGLGLDTLFGGLDDDRLFGGAGNDVLNGEDGLDELNGDAGNDTLRGGSGNDLLWGYEGNDILEGGDGDDQLDGMDGDDRLIGGVGDDSLIGGMGHDVLLGGIGNDRLFGGAGNDSLGGEDGNDELSGNVGHDVLQGGAGNDTLYGHEDNDVLDGGAGDDLLEGMDGIDQLLGGIGDDTLIGDEGIDYLIGGAGNDGLFGGAGNDILDGGDGNDELSGNSGNDNLRGGAGNDFLYGHDGNDSIDGGEDNDQLFGLNDNDWLIGGKGDDYLLGGTGNDTLLGNDGLDELHGQEGDDVLSGWTGDDYLTGDLGNDILLGDFGNDGMYGLEGDDILLGGDGDDRLDGGIDDDHLLGGAGTDRLEGNEGNDKLFGEVGNDELVGTYGIDYLIAGAGNDKLWVASGQHILVGGDGDDVITGFNLADVIIGGEGTDRIDGLGGDDLLVGGATGYDTNVVQLAAIMAAWTSTAPYATRVAEISNSAFAARLVSNETLFDDHVADQIYGKAGQDWFFLPGVMQVYDPNLVDEGGHTHGVSEPSATGQGHSHPGAVVIDHPPELEGFDFVSSLDVITDRQQNEALHTLIPHADDPVLQREHLTLNQLVRYDQVTHFAVNSGDWSSSGTWHDGIVPTNGARVLIPVGVTVAIDGVISARLATVRVDGTLSFSTTASSELRVDTIVVTNLGRFEMGTEAAPIPANFKAQLTITDSGPIDRVADPFALGRGLISHGSVSMHGSFVESYAAIAGTALAGSSLLTLNAIPAGWKVGDSVVLASSTAGAQQNETRTIMAIVGTIVYLDRPLSFSHTPGLAGAAVHVANLTRNVFIYSESNVVDRRGHLMFMHNRDVHIANAGFYQLGRTDKSRPINDAVVDANWQLKPGTGTNPRARYSVHFHRNGFIEDGNPSTVTGSVVLGSPGWGFVNHSSYVAMADNVAFDVFGAGFATEVGDEIGSFTNNLAIGGQGVVEEVETRQNIQDFGQNGDGFWFQGTGIRVTGNIAAGNNGHAFIVFARGLIEGGVQQKFLSANLPDPSIAGGAAEIDVNLVPMFEFSNNTGYSSGIGFAIWHHLRDSTHGVKGEFTNSLFWNNVEGMEIPYTQRTILRDLVIVRNATEYAGIGIKSNIVTSGIEYQNLTVKGYFNGIVLPKRGANIVYGGVFSNQMDLQILNAVSAGRTVLITGPIQLGNIVMDHYYAVNGNYTADALLLDQVTLNFGPFHNQRLYYTIQKPDAVPYPTALPGVPAAYIGLTSQQLWNLYHVAIGGELVPAATTTSPLVFGLVGPAA